MALTGKMQYRCNLAAYRKYLKKRVGAQITQEEEFWKKRIIQPKRQAIKQFQEEKARRQDSPEGWSGIYDTLIEAQRADIVKIRRKLWKKGGTGIGK